MIRFAGAGDAPGDDASRDTSVKTYAVCGPTDWPEFRRFGVAVDIVCDSVLKTGPECIGSGKNQRLIQQVVESASRSVRPEDVKDVRTGGRIRRIAEIQATDTELAVTAYGVSEVAGGPGR